MLGMVGLLAIGSWVWAMTGVIVGATSGALIGWVAGMGLSRAWEDTFAADDSGTFAVGVHSDHPEEAAHGESVLRRQGSLAVNRFS